MKVCVLNANIRGCEVKVGKTTGNQYLLVRFEDEAGAAEQVVDRNMDRQPLYCRNAEGTIYMEIKTGRTKTGSYANISITDFVPKCSE